VQHVLIHHDTNLLDVTLSTATTLPKVSQPGQDASARKQQQAAVAAHGSQAPPTSETIHTTTEHPFLTQELGWVDASDLKPGEHVRRMDGSLGVVIGVTVVAGEAVRYNLTVAHDHTFLVGADQWVVHNCGVGDGTTYYRTMSESDFEALKETGELPATAETFISPLESYAAKYRGALVKFTMKEGFLNAIKEVGVRDISEIVSRTLGDDMPLVSKGWAATNAFFKGEGSNLVNIGLGRGRALEIFNGAIESWERIR
jgi:hypothetical protein